MNKFHNFSYKNVYTKSDIIIIVYSWLCKNVYAYVDINEHKYAQLENFIFQKNFAIEKICRKTCSTSIIISV